MKLRISEDLALPLEFVTQTQAILAKKRVGKTYTAKVQAEELLKANQQIVAIDPTGAWWGLKSSADGKHEGFPIAVFGGEHADVPLEESAGETIATALVEQRFSAILDLSLFRKGQINRFMTPFLETLYRLNREAMHLFVDEADSIAPQKPFGEEARMLGAMEDVVRRGGIRGIGTTLITQRPAVINKNVLTQCEILCSLRIVHHKDIDAIHEWVAVHGDENLAKEMIASLPSLPTGTAWFWAPGFGDIFKQVRIRQLETFDSGATPKAGETKRTAKVLATVDLAKLGAQITATVQRVKENDPKELKRKIADLQKQVQSKSPVVDEHATNKAVQQAVSKVEQAYRQQVQTLTSQLSKMQNAFTTIARQAVAFTDVQIPLAKIELPARTAAPQRTIARPTPRKSEGPPPEGISAVMIRVLSRLEELLQCTGASMVRKEQLAAWAEYSPTSGSFANYLGQLRSAGLIDYPQGGYVALTEDGRALAKPEDVPTTSDEILERAKRVLGGSEAKLLELIHANQQKAMAKDELAELAGFSPTSGGYANYLGHMRTLGFIDYPQKGMVRCADWMFL